jgi:hypothetical protein
MLCGRPTQWISEVPVANHIGLSKYRRVVTSTRDKMWCLAYQAINSTKNKINRLLILIEVVAENAEYHEPADEHADSEGLDRAPESEG